MTGFKEWYYEKFSPAKENWMCFDTPDEAVKNAYYICAVTELDCWLRDYAEGADYDDRFVAKVESVPPETFIGDFLDWFDDCEGTYEIFADNDARWEAFMSFVRSFNNN